MHPADRRTARTHDRRARVAVVAAALVALVVSLGGLLRSGEGRTLGLAAEPFSGTSLTAPESWGITSANGSTPPCLTARSSEDIPIILGSGTITGCTANPDPNGQGALRLTDASTNQSGALEVSRSFPVSAGIDVQFTIAEWGGTNPGADGLAFYLRDGGTSGYAMGGAGAGLGYSPSSGYSNAGLPGALLAIGFDANGGFSNDDAVPSAVRSGCADTYSGDHDDTIAIRRGDTSLAKDGSSGYCVLDFTTPAAQKPSFPTRSAGTRAVRIVIDPAGTPEPKVSVYASPWGSTVVPTVATIAVPVPAEYLAASSFRFGWSAGTGGRTDNHEVWDFALGSAIDPCTTPPTTSLGGTTTTLFDCSAVWAATTTSSTSTTIGATIPWDPATTTTVEGTTTTVEGTTTTDGATTTTTYEAGTTSTTGSTSTSTTTPASTSTTAPASTPTSTSTSTTNTTSSTTTTSTTTSTSSSSTTSTSTSTTPSTSGTSTSSTSTSSTTSLPPSAGVSTTIVGVVPAPAVAVLGAAVTPTTAAARPLALTGTSTTGLLWQAAAVLLVAIAALALSRTPLTRRHRVDQHPDDQA